MRDYKATEVVESLKQKDSQMNLNTFRQLVRY